MQQDKEQKIFLSILWTFLLGSLTFFVLRLSVARILLPAPVWYMLLLLDAGFIIFTFVPHPGWGVPGVAGRHEETIREHAWYPQNLSEIVEGRGEAANEKRAGVRPPSRAVPPVPLVPLVLLLICIALAYPRAPEEKHWQSKETERLRIVYGKTENEFLRLEALASELEERAGAAIDWGTAMSMAPGERAALIQKIDSLVSPCGSIGRRSPKWDCSSIHPRGSASRGAGPRTISNESSRGFPGVCAYSRAGRRSIRCS